MYNSIVFNYTIEKNGGNYENFKENSFSCNGYST